MSSSLPVDLEGMKPPTPDTALSSLAFCLTGKVDSKITTLLESRGAKKRSYAGVATTHLIAGAEADEMRVDEAKDIFEVPVVTSEWALLCLHLGKVIPVDGFERHHKKLFSAVVVATSGIRGKDLVTLWTLITYYGGAFRKALTSNCTHLISNECTGTAYKIAKEKGLKIVCSDWVIECVKSDSLVEESRFDPLLTVLPTDPSVFNPPPAPSAKLSQSSTKVPSATTDIKTPVPVSSPALTSSSPVNVNQYNQYSMVRPAPSGANHQNILQNQLLTQSSPSTRAPVPLNSLAANNVQGGRMRFPSVRVGLNSAQQINTVQGQAATQGAGHQLNSSQVPGHQLNSSPVTQSPGQQINNVGQLAQSPGHQINSPQTAQSPGHQLNVAQGPQGPGHQLNPGQVVQNSGHQPGAGQVAQGGNHQLMQSQGQNILHNQVPPQGIKNQGQQIIIQQQRPQQLQSPGTQQQMMPNQMSQGGPQMMWNPHPMQNQGPQQHQFQQQHQYQPQAMQQFQAQNPIKSPVSQQQFNQMQPSHIIPNQQHQVRFPLSSPQPQNQQQGHFQLIQSQQIPNRPQSAMGQMQHRGQFQSIQQQNPQTSNALPMGQQIYRQQQPQCQIPIYHSIQQQRLQSPPLAPQQQQSGNQQQGQLQQQHLQQGQLQQGQLQQVQLQQGQLQQVQLQQGQLQPGQLQQVQLQPGQMQQGQLQQVQLQPGQMQQGQLQQVQLQPGQMQQGQLQQVQLQSGQLQQSQLRPVQIQQGQLQQGQIQQSQLQQGQLQAGQLQQGQLQQSQLQQGQLQQSHLSQPQMMSPQGQQGQPQHYSVVIGHQQFQQNQSTISVHGQPMQHQQQGQQPGMQPQRVPFQPRTPNQQWSQQQQMDIIQHIQRDPLVRAQWSRMDNTQRQLLMQKLAQKKREEVLRDMLLRQQHMTQQSGGGQNVGPQPNSSPQQIVLSSNQIGAPQSQGILSGQPDKPMGQPLHPSHSPGQVGLPIAGQQSSQVHPNQVLMQNHQHQQIITQQKVANPQMSPNNQKFMAPPAPVQTRPQAHGVIGTPQQQSPQSTGVVRTQQIFTPQVGQQQQQQQQQVRIHLIQHPGQRPPGMQQQMPNQKIPILQQQQMGQPNNQWNPSQQQRVMTPGPQSPFSSNRPPGTPDSPSGTPPQWTVRPQSQSPQSPGGQSSVSYVQVVNSKTKTALANLLSNRLQGNAGPESNTTSFTSTLTTTTSTTQAMCPPPPPPVTSQSLPHSAPTTTQSNVLAQRRTLANLTNGCKTIQVNNFGSTRVAQSQPSPTLSVSPSRPQFFGHDPQAKLPPKAYFMGCVFWVTEDVPKIDQWQLVVQMYGGAVVSEYAPTVTHILCTTHKFPEFTQGLREGKRMVSVYWMNDIVLKGMHVPPYQVLHFPSLFSRDDLPLLGHVAATTNFSDADRRRVMRILEMLGAQITAYFSQFNTFLICNKPEGPKYQKAREWKIPVVNIHFLNELYLGHQSALQMIHSPKYQCFNPDQPFRVDYALAPHLMAGWKVPIRVGPDVNEQFKTIKRTADEKLSKERNCKRIKLENGEADDTTGEEELSKRQYCQGWVDKTTTSPINGFDVDDEPLSPDVSIERPPSIVEKQITVDAESQTIISKVEKEEIEEATSDIECTKIEKLEIDDNLGEDDSMEVCKNEVSQADNRIIGPMPPLIRIPTPVVIASGFTRMYKDKIASKVAILGGRMANDWTEATHLVLKEHYMTTKLFLAMCRFQHIVSVQWIYESMVAGHFVDEKDYGVQHNRFEQHYGQTISEVLEKPSRQFLFKGVTFFMTPGPWILKKDVEVIIEAAGGVVDRTQKSLRHIRDYCSRFPKRSVIITSRNDFELMEEFFLNARRPHVINIYTDDFIWQCVATQKVKLRQSQP